MKEASGELSMTAIAVVAIAAIGIVFTTLIWPTIRSNIDRSTRCAQAFNCDACGEGAATSECDWINEEGNVGAPRVLCPCER